MKVETTRFGELEVEESSIIKMPKGPIGFESYTDFVVIEHRPDTEFRWLQSAEDPTLAFVVVDPSKFFTEYEIEISDSDVDKLHLTSEADATVLVIVTIAEAGKEITANLAAPVIINSKELIGTQIVVQDSRYSVKTPLVAYIDKPTEEKTTVKAA
ncbi:MAG: flagellar assembly protein FliW [Armatimonadetes bacterium]|nr:flagellar assembly protein FliW [Armatimonadota bacterium]